MRGPAHHAQGFFDSTSGEIDERAHAYIIDKAAARPGDRPPFDFGPKDTPTSTRVGAGGFVGGKQAEAGEPDVNNDSTRSHMERPWKTRRAANGV